MSDILKQLHFLRRKLSEVHKKGTIWDVAITFCLKQGQTRASRGPITLPLRMGAT